MRRTAFFTIQKSSTKELTEPVVFVKSKDVVEGSPWFELLNQKMQEWQTEAFNASGYNKTYLGWYQKESYEEIIKNYLRDQGFEVRKGKVVYDPRSEPKVIEVEEPEAKKIERKMNLLGMKPKDKVA